MKINQCNLENTGEKKGRGRGKRGGGGRSGRDFCPTRRAKNRGSRTIRIGYDTWWARCVEGRVAAALNLAGRGCGVYRRGEKERGVTKA